MKLSWIYDWQNIQYELASIVIFINLKNNKGIQFYLQESCIQKESYLYDDLQL